MKIKTKSPKAWPEPTEHPRTKRGDRRFDQSSLRASSYGRIAHRDYAAHWFRWGFAARFCKQDMRVLDIGCGPDQTLPMVLRTSQAHVPSLYVGVDLNHLTRKTGMAWTRIHDKFNYVDDWKKLKKEHGGDFDVIVCFEVIEHMKREDGLRLLQSIRAMLAPDGVALVSTPVYNERHMAANHVHEYRFQEMREVVAEAGLEVDRVHGTFMTAAAIKRVASPEERRLVDELSRFYSWDVLANFLAPKYPEASSNCCWVLRRAA